MKKHLSRILSLALVLTLCMMLAAPVFAIGGSRNGENDMWGAPLTVDTYVTFDKNFIMEKTANVPGRSFWFTLSPLDTSDTNNQSDADTITAYNGILEGVKITRNTNTTSPANKTETTITRPETAPDTVLGSYDFDVAIYAGQDTTDTWPFTHYPENYDNSSNEDANYKYATTPFELDFSGVNFEQPGVYRYVLTETVASTGKNDDADVTYDTVTYYIDVYVEYQYTWAYDLRRGDEEYDSSTDTDISHWSNKLTIGSIVVSKNNVLTVDGTTEEYADEYENNSSSQTSEKKVNASDSDSNKGGGYDGKTPDGGVSEADFNNPLATYDLTIEKIVTGNQAEHDKEFTFTLELEGVPEGAQYEITFKNGSDTNDTNAANKTDGSGVEQEGTSLAAVHKTTAADANGKSTTTFTLKYSNPAQQIVIENLPAGAKWTVKETDYSGAGYTTSTKVSEDSSEKAPVLQSNLPHLLGKDGNDLKYGDTVSIGAYDNNIWGDTDVTITNLREGTIPTGILLTIAPFAVLMLVGVLGAAIVLKKRRTA